MKDLSLHDLSARVVAWHNRHPLARRVTAANVHSVGYVVLPYLAGGGASAAAAGPAVAAAVDAPGAAPAPPVAASPAAPATAAVTTPAPAPQPAAQSAPTSATLEAAFSEDFIAPLLPSQVARWAALHGVTLAAPRADAPVRHIAPNDAVDLTRLHPLWLLTAQLEVGRSRTRVLVGAGDEPAVLGRRLWSSARIAGLVAVVAVLAAGAMALQSGQPAPANAVPPPVAAAASGASVASVASVASSVASAPSVPSAASVASAVLLAASAPADTSSTAPTPSASTPAAPVAAPAEPAGSAVEAARPVDVEPTLGRVVLPPIGPRAGVVLPPIDPRADEWRRAAGQARQQASPALGAAASVPARAAAVAPAFAVSTRLLRTRTESEQTAAAMRALLVTAATPQMHVEVIPAGDDWRVVGWPFANRAQADKARALLAGRGMRVEVIDF